MATSSAVTDRNSKLRWPLTFYLLCVVIFIASSIVVQSIGVDASLKASVWGQTVVVILWVGGALIWGLINASSDEAIELAPLLSDAAKLVVSVDGVVLGLIYAFVARGNSIPLVVRVGALSLMTGVVLGLFLYSLVAGKIQNRNAAAVSTAVLTLAAWALTFGLMCIVFELVIPK